MSKISQYANSVAALGTDDLFDVSEKISSGPDVYESRKMTGAVLATFIQSYTSNILNTNSLTLGGNYTHDFAGNQLVFNNGNLGVVGEIGVTAFNVGQVNVFVAGDELGQSILSVKNAGNVGVGTLTPDASAVLDASSTDSGFLVPRMTTAQKTAITTPAESLIVYDTDLNGFQYYNSVGAWTAFDSNFANTDLTVGAGREHTLTDTVRIKGGTFQVEGLNTLGTASAFELYDGDTTPNKLWDWRNNGDVYLGAEQTLFNVASDSKTAFGIWDRNGSDKQVKTGSGAFRDINELAFLATGRSSSGLLDSAFQFHDFIFEAPDSAIFGIAGASGAILNLHYNGGLNSLTSTSTEYGFNNELRYFTSEETFWLGRGFVKEQSGNKRPNTMLHLFDYSQGGQGGLTFFVGDRTATGADSVLRGGQIRWDINTRNTTSFSNDFITLTPNGNATGNLYYAEFKNTSGSVALKINGNDALPQLPEFTVAGVPAADADNKGGFVCITDETGGYVTAFSDGTNWRRTTDRAIIS